MIERSVVSTSLCAPAARMVLVCSFAINSEDNGPSPGPEATWAAETYIYPVLAIKSTVYRYANGERFDGLSFVIHEGGETGLGEYPGNSDLDDCVNGKVSVEYAPWEPSEDRTRLAELIRQQEAAVIQREKKRTAARRAPSPPPRTTEALSHT